MAITKKSSRQEQVVAYNIINAVDFATTPVGTSTDVVANAILLPTGAIIVSGDLIVTTAFNTVGVLASGVLTAVSTYTPTANDTITIGSQVYKFVASLTASTTAYEVLIDGATNSYTNLVSAINAVQTAGIVGVKYGSLTPINTTVTAVKTSTYVVTVTSKVNTAANDTVGTTSTTSVAAWAATTLVDWIAPADTIAVKIGSTTYLSATTVDAVGRTALVPTGVATTAESYVTVTWDAVATSTVVPTAGTFILDIQYYIKNRAEFSEG
jgi:hypothetical protein